MAAIRTAVLLCLAALCHQVAAFSKISDVPFTELDEATGKHFVATVTGKKWQLHESKEHGKVYFVEQSSQNSTWDDPRSMPLTAEERAALPPDIVALHDKQMFAEGAMTADGKPYLGSSSAVVTVVAIVPLILFAATMAGRIWYLQTYYPELLFPIKERKSRVKGSAKFKAQKARGKMSQDGKGGRSNNTQ